jgi:nucleotide-binding universal stress UspA family protein
VPDSNTPSTYRYPRYLAAKKTVDDRALNERVWRCFVEALEARGPSLRVLEVGGGVGATVERLVSVLENREVDTLAYTLVDIAPENIEAAVESLREWAEARGYRVSTTDGATPRQRWSDGPLSVSVRFVTADLHEVSPSAPCDALVAQAVFDLMDVPAALRALRSSLQEDGLWYVPIHFDGVTAFEPPINPALDAAVEELYHESMTDEEGGRHGVHSGRRLLTHLRDAGAEVLAAGGSDWVVVPGPDGYVGDEAYFLHHILHFIEEELSGHPDLAATRLADWMQTRRAQIEAEELVYLTHQLDVLAQMS